MKSIFNKIRKGILGIFYIKTCANPEEIIFIAGSGRSGTTWLAEILNHKNEYLYVFEPYHPKKVKGCKFLFENYYIRESSTNKSFFDLTNNIIRGELRNFWINKENKKILIDKILIKEIRSNLFLKHIKGNFSQIKILFIIRHPFAVASSQMKGFEKYGNWFPNLQKISNQKELIDDFLMDKLDFIKNINAYGTLFEKIVLKWAIENYIPFKQFKNNEMHLVFYEMLYSNYKTEISNIFNYLGKKYSKEIFQYLTIPSALTRNDSAIITGNNPLIQWKKRFNGIEIEKGLRIIELFGLDKIYSLNEFPSVSNLDEIKILLK